MLAALHAECFPVSERWDEAAMRALLSMPGCQAAVSGDAGDGLVLWRVAADEAELLTLGVCPVARRAGRGGALLSGAMGAARDAGAARMFLEVAATNVAAMTLYRRAGFVPVGCRRRYYPDGGDATVMSTLL